LPDRLKLLAWAFAGAVIVAGLLAVYAAGPLLTFFHGPLRSLPELSLANTDGFVDLAFKIVAVERFAQETQVLVRARRGSELAGFAALLTEPWTASSIPGVDLTLRQGKVSIVSVGVESDAFLRALYDAYGVAGSTARMTARVDFMAVSLSGDPHDLKREPLKLKLFFEGDTGTAEVFLNLDEGRSIVEFAEKDPEHRHALLKALTAPAAK
jgi:hypothetical protein